LIANLVKLNVGGLDDLYVTQGVAEFFSDEVDGVHCVSRLMGFDVDYNQLRKGSKSCIRIGFYKEQTFYFELMLMYGFDKILDIKNISFVFNEMEISKEKVMTKCNEINLYWDGFYDISVSDEEGLKKLFQLMNFVV
jgi:hypothetical protein